MVHNAVRNQVALLAKEGGYQTRLEPVGAMPIRPGEARGRRPDILCQDVLRAGRLQLDITVADPLQPGVLRGGCHHVWLRSGKTGREQTSVV